MCNKERQRLSCGLHLTPSRTRALVLGLVLAAAGWLPPLACAQVEIDLLGGNGLEASMSSSLLSGFQEETESLQSLKAQTAFPDSAMVGRIFQLKMPNKVEDSYMGEIVQVSPRGFSLKILGFVSPLVIDPSKRIRAEILLTNQCSETKSSLLGALVCKMIKDLNRCSHCS